MGVPLGKLWKSGLASKAGPTLWDLLTAYGTAGGGRFVPRREDLLGGGGDANICR
jgi:hypothetical protein